MCVKSGFLFWFRALCAIEQNKLATGLRCFHYRAYLGKRILVLCHARFAFNARVKAFVGPVVDSRKNLKHWVGRCGSRFAIPSTDGADSLFPVQQMAQQALAHRDVKPMKRCAKTLFAVPIGSVPQKFNI